MKRRAALRAVVDTNLFVSGLISPRGLPGKLIGAWKAGGFELILPASQLAELNAVIQRPKIIERFHVTPQARNDLLEGLALDAIADTSTKSPVSSRDAKDDFLLAAALNHGADCLVTGDNDLLVLRSDPRLGRLQIVTVSEFLSLLSEAETGKQREEHYSALQKTCHPEERGISVKGRVRTRKRRDSSHARNDT